MPHHKPVHRYLIALMVMVSLLFSQLALASYVCPGMNSGTAAMAQMMADGKPCEGMDTVQPVLCHEHAADASHSFEKWQPVMPTLPAVVHVLAVPLVLLSDRRGLNLQGVPALRPPPDPVFFSTRRLRV
jgi:hypothetical protein